MKLDRLDVYNLRNINNLSLSELGDINLFYGANGAGKTTLLEAIHLLALGRSFRSAQSRRVIRYDADFCAAVGVVSDQAGSRKLGIQRKRSGGFTIRIDGETAKSASSLAKILPIQLLNSESFSLLEQGPKKRRQLLDWGVFHVEHSFHGAWARAQRAIKQRNSLLKQRLPANKLQTQIDPWDRELANAGHSLLAMRESYFKSLSPILSEMIKRLTGIKEVIDIRLISGWRLGGDGSEEELVDRSALYAAIKANAGREQQRGMTIYGPHRADIALTINGIDVGHVLSRGQQKMVVCALKLAQSTLFSEKTGRSSILLADDLPAELDIDHQEKLYSALDELDCQSFLTSVNPATISDSGWTRKGPIKKFHVKHGEIDG